MEGIIMKTLDKDRHVISLDSLKNAVTGLERLKNSLEHTYGRQSGVAVIERAEVLLQQAAREYAAQFSKNELHDIALQVLLGEARTKFEELIEDIQLRSLVGLA